MTVSQGEESRTTLKVRRRIELTEQALAKAPRSRKPAVEIRLRNLTRELRRRESPLQ